MRRGLAIAWKAILVIAVWLGIGWLTGLLHPPDVSLGVELRMWAQVPGIGAVVTGAALVLIWGRKTGHRTI